MSSIVVAGDTSGSVTISAPAVAGTTTLTLPTTNGTIITTGSTTGLDASAISSGTMATARLGSGSATSSTYLRGDQTWAAVAGIPAGTIIQFAGTSAPTGYLLCPTSLTNISRTTYADLFAAIGTTWGSGDGSTTFGLPWFTADFAAVQASANVGTSTTGSVIAHTHTYNGGTIQNQGSNVGNNIYSAAGGTTSSTGGTNNLAAGARVLFCIKY